MLRQARSWVRTPTNACGYMVCKYVDRKCSAAMLVVKRSAGVAPEVNLRNSLHAGKKAHKPLFHPGFETQGRHHHTSKIRVSMIPQKGLMFSINLKKSRLLIELNNIPIHANQLNSLKEISEHTSKQFI